MALGFVEYVEYCIAGALSKIKRDHYLRRRELQLGGWALSPQHTHSYVVCSYLMSLAISSSSKALWNLGNQ